MACAFDARVQPPICAVLVNMTESVGPLSCWLLSRCGFAKRPVMSFIGEYISDSPERARFGHKPFAESAKRIESREAWIEFHFRRPGHFFLEVLLPQFQSRAVIISQASHRATCAMAWNFRDRFANVLLR
jgi:hypothetical protein